MTERIFSVGFGAAKSGETGQFWAVDTNGDDLIAQTSSGVTELGTSGNYSIEVNWDSSWIALILWNLVGLDATAIDSVVPALPSYALYTRPITASFGAAKSGLTVTFSVQDLNGNVLTSGDAIEYQGGCYYAFVTDWNPLWSGKIVWDAEGTELQDTFEPNDIHPATSGTSFFYPHSVLVRPVTNDAEGASNVAVNPTLGDVATVAVNLQDRTPGQLFQEFGVELSAGARMYCRPADISHFTNGAQVSKGSFKYTVHSVPVLRDGISRLAHCVVILDRKVF